MKRNSKVYLLILFSWMTSADVVFGQNKTIDSLIQVAAAHPQQDDARALLLMDLCTRTLQYNAKQALKYPEEVLTFENKIKDKKLVSTAYRTKGVIHYHLAMYPEALNALNKAYNIDFGLKHELGCAAAQANLGLVYMTQSKFPEALKYFLEALKTFEKTNSDLQAASVMGNIGVVYTEMADYNAARNYLQRSLPLLTKLKNHVAQSGVLANIGIVNFKNKNIPEAIRYSRMSLNIADSIGDSRSSARETGNLSAYFNELKKHDLALQYGLKAIDLNIKNNNKKSLGFNMQNVSAAYLGLGDYGKAKSYGLNALQAGREVNVTEIKRDASLNLSEVYEALKMPDSALIYYREHTMYADSISNDIKKNEITRMGIQFDFDKKEFTYKQKELLSEAQIRQQQLQLALNEVELQKELQLKKLQASELQNEKLRSREKEKQLFIASEKEKLQASRLKQLSQQQQLSRLELNQFWLYAILTGVILVSVLVYLLNLYRIRQLKFKNTLQQHQAIQNELELKHQYQLSESELKALRSQMNPHFIFNVLNSIESYVIDNEKKKASRLIQKFASLSRLILENSTKSLTTGEKEWKALMLYTELEAMRSADAFTYSFSVADDIQLNTLLLPPMLIQPLIENAILHGLLPSAKADAHVAVTMERNDDGICITIADNGVGINNKVQNKHRISIKEQSIGLASIKERIEMINEQQGGNKASFSIGPGIDQQGTVARICLPYFS